MSCVTFGRQFGNGCRILSDAGGFPHRDGVPPYAACLNTRGAGETVLSLKSVLPGLPMIAALSANHLAALEFAPMLARLYVARDRDAAGRMAAERLHARGSAAGIDVRDLTSV
jgi:hypothetical protein